MARDTLLCPPDYYEQNRFKPASGQLELNDLSTIQLSVLGPAIEPSRLGCRFRSHTHLTMWALENATS